MKLFSPPDRSSLLKPAFVLLLGLIASVENGVAQENDDKQRDGQEVEATDRIALEDLPTPPAEIATLIAKGNVTFFTGRIPWSEMQLARERTGLSGTRLRLAAETKVEFKYDYKSRTRWRQWREGTKTIVSVTVRFSSVDLKVDHRIWFRHPPSFDVFWDDSVVQHEFDHVRLSTHPMLNKLFAKNLKSISRFRHELTDDQRVGEDLVNELVRQRVKEAFTEISDLVNIRYRELDQITRHGLEAVPAESELESWLTLETGRTDGQPASLNEKQK